MKKIKALMIVGMMSVVLAACGGREDEGANETNAPVSASEAQQDDLSAAGEEDSTDAQNGEKQDDSAVLNAAAEELLKNAGFEDELNPADKATVEKLYGIGNAKEAVVYLSSGATAEEIALFSFESEEDAKQAEELARARIQEQKESFESYIPKEVKKLDDAVIKRSGKYLAVCVADGKEAGEILSKYF